MNNLNQKNEANKLFKEWNKFWNEISQDKPLEIMKTKANGSSIKIDHKTLNGLEKRLLNSPLQQLNKKDLQKLKRGVINKKLKEKIDNIIEKN